MNWDVFISHAAEDKEEVARPLAHALRDAGYRVWYDEFALSLGDSLVRSIDRGLAESRYGIVIVSPRFLAKDWPRRELEGLVTREIGRGKVVLPVWHGVTREQIERYSPPLADRLGVSTGHGLGQVVAQVRQVLDGGAAPEPAPAPPRRRLLLAGSAAAVLAAAGGGAWWWQARRAAQAAAISGRWRIEERGDMLRSTLDLKLVDGRLEGQVRIHYPDRADFVAAGLYAQREVPIEDAEFDGTRLAFVTRRRFRKSLHSDGADSMQVLRYRGRLDGEVLALAIQVEGGPRVEAQARRPPPAPAGSSLLATLPAAAGATQALSALPGGRVAAVHGPLVRVWRIDAASGRATWVEWTNRQPVRGLVPLDDERVLVVEDHGLLEERDLRSGERRRFLAPGVPHLTEAVLALPDGRVAISIAGGGLVLWNLAQGAVERTLRDAGGLITHLARLPDGRLAAADANAGLRLWSLDSGRAEQTLREGDVSVGSGPSGLVALPDGRLVMGLPDRGRPLVIDPRGGVSVALDPGGAATWCRVLGRTADGQVLLVDSRDLVSRWNLAGGTSRPLVDFSDDEIGVDCALDLAPARLLLGRRDGSLQLWSIA